LAILAITWRFLDKLLKELKEEGKIMHVGLKRLGHWRLREAAIGSGKSFYNNVEKLRKRGWLVGRVNGPNIEWIDELLQK